MKTAMQLMVWYLENEGLKESGAYYKAKMLLEKEKEQIVEAFDYYKSQPFTGFDDEYVHTGKEYYNAKYNQNTQPYSGGHPDIKEI